MRLLFLGCLTTIFSFQIVFAQWVTKIETEDRVMSFTVSGTSIYAAAGQGTVLRSDDKGETWINISQGIPETDLTAITLCGGIMFVSTSDQGIYRSTDSGVSWTPMNDGLTTPNTFDLASDDSTVFTATYRNGIFKSSDKINWQISSEGLNNLNVLAVTYNNGKLYAGMDDGSVYISANGGSSWDSVGSGAERNGILDLTVDGNNIFIGTAGDGIFVTSDNGSNWSPINNGLNTYVWDIVPFNDQLFAATSGGVFTSSDNGASWISINDGLPGGSFGDIIYSLTRDDEYLYAGNGWSILRRPLSEVTDVEGEPELPENFRLEQNFPNPFNPETSIEYSIPQVGTHHGVFLQLKVYDVLGNEVAELVNEEKPAGVYKIKFDASRLSSGIYFYTLKAGNFSETRKMVLLR